MLFNSFPFVLFFVVLYGLVRVTPRRFIAPLLLAASLLFYTAWHPVYLLLLLAEAAANYALMRWMLRSRHSAALLGASIVLTLGVLALLSSLTLLVHMSGVSEGSIVFFVGLVAFFVVLRLRRCFVVGLGIF